MTTLLLMAMAVALQADTAQSVPDFLIADQFEIEGHIIKVGMSWGEAVEALGPKAKLKGKAQQTTTEEILAAQQRALSIAPWQAPLIHAITDAAQGCGSCWMAGIERALTKRDTLRVMGMGADERRMIVAMIAIDRGRTVGSMARQAWKDAGQHAGYFVTDDRVYRMSRVGNIVRVEKMK